MTEEFLRFIEHEKNVMPRTLEDYRAKIRVLGPILQMSKYSDISEAIIKIKLERQLSDVTTYKFVIVASEYFKFLVRRGAIDKNPLQDHCFKKNSKHRIEFFDWADPQFKKLFSNPHLTIRTKCLLLVLKSSGIRSNECCLLKRKNVQGRWLEIENGKGGIARTAPIDEETRYWLGVYLDCLKDHYAGEWLFPREDYKTHITPSGLGKMLTRMGEKCVPPIHIFPHKFRHSVATNLIAKGNCDIAVCAEILGHKDIRTTQRYTHVQPKDILVRYDHALKSL